MYTNLRKKVFLLDEVDRVGKAYYISSVIIHKEKWHAAGNAEITDKMAMVDLQAKLYVLVKGTWCNIILDSGIFSGSVTQDSNQNLLLGVSWYFEFCQTI